MDKEIKNFNIENLAQVEGVIKEIEENFAKEENEQASIVIKYSDSIDKEEFLQSLKLLWHIVKML